MSQEIPDPLPDEVEDIIRSCALKVARQGPDAIFELGRLMNKLAFKGHRLPSEPESVPFAKQLEEAIEYIGRVRDTASAVRTILDVDKEL